MALVGSVYTTVVIALERYIALRNPFTMRRGSEHDFAERVAAWLQVAKWVGPAILFSIVFNIPTFLEYCAYPEGRCVDLHCISVYLLYVEANIRRGRGGI